MAQINDSQPRRRSRDHQPSIDLRLDQGLAARLDSGRSVAELNSARATLVLHRLDRAQRCCCTCGQSAPCPAAQDAAQVLADAGAWNTMPLEPTPESTAKPPAGPLAGDDGSRIPLPRLLTELRRRWRN
jgi:hypothetical protein